MEELLLLSCCQEQEHVARSNSRKLGLVLILSVKLGLLTPAEVDWAGGAFIEGGHSILKGVQKQGSNSRFIFSYDTQIQGRTRTRTRYRTKLCNRVCLQVMLNINIYFLTPFLENVMVRMK